MNKNLSCVFFKSSYYTVVVRRCLLKDVHFSSTKFWEMTPQVTRNCSTQTVPLSNNVVTHKHFRWRWNMINFTYSGSTEYVDNHIVSLMEGIPTNVSKFLQ